MTKKRAERLLGCPVEIRENPAAPDYFFAYGDGVGVPGKTAKAAIEELVRAVYQLRSKAVFAKSRYRCDICGKLLPLQSHHKTFRSHGGTHEAKNLGSRCQTCHDKEHGRGSR